MSEDFLSPPPLPDPPSFFVSKYYIMDPREETVFIDGFDLKVGMNVLVADPELLVDVMSWGPDPLLTTTPDYHRALVNNRWCTILALVIKQGMVRFVGGYADGTRYPRAYNVNSVPWFVRLNSIKGDWIPRTQRRSEDGAFLSDPYRGGAGPYDPIQVGSDGVGGSHSFPLVNPNPEPREKLLSVFRKKNRQEGFDDQVFDVVTPKSATDEEEGPDTEVKSNN